MNKKVGIWRFSWEGGMRKNEGQVGFKYLEVQGCGSIAGCRKHTRKDACMWGKL